MTPLHLILSIAFAIPPFIIVILFWIFQDEPARWLLTKQKYEKAIETLTKMAKQNGRVNILYYILNNFLGLQDLTNIG